MKKWIAVTGGGTGGHIYPGLAIADYFHNLSDFSIMWIGNKSGIDRMIVNKSSSIDCFFGIACGTLRRYFSFQNFIDFF